MVSLILVQEKGLEMSGFEYGMFNFYRYLRAAARATDETTRDFYFEMAFKWRRAAIDSLIYNV
jgi:hypothetical protein